MGYVVGIGEMGGREVRELPSAVSTVRCSSDTEQNGDARGATGVDEDELEVSSNRNFSVTILNLDRLREAATGIAEGKANSRFRRWGLIALATWAATATALAIMEWNTIVQLQSITAKMLKAVPTDEVHK
jgi:hypothetical protein